MIPHYLSPTEIVVDIDFARGWLLVGELARRGDPQSVCRHIRWRVESGKWCCDRPGRDAQPRPTMDGEAHEWRRGPAPRETLSVTYATAFVVVNRRDLVKALDSVRKLAGDQALAVDGLVTLRTHAGGLGLCSHGARSLRIDLVCTDVDEPARDGLGTAVVCGSALLAVAKAVQTNHVQVDVGAWGVGQCVRLWDRSVWTANVSPMPVRLASEVEFVDLGLTGALERALVFASTDAARPNLHHILVAGRGDHLHIVATDGHRLYHERVTTSFAVAAFGKRKCLLPRAALVSLRSGKRGGNYRFAFDGNDVVIACDDRTIACAPSSLTFPPYSQLIPARLLEHEPAFGGSLVELSPETAVEFRRWVREQVKADLRYVNDRGHESPRPVQLTIEAGGNVRLQIVDNDPDDDPDDDWPAVAGVGRVIVSLVTAGTGAFEARFFLTYVADALEALDKKEATHVAVGSGQLDPVYLFDSTRIVCVMPQRY